MIQSSWVPHNPSRPPSLPPPTHSLNTPSFGTVIAFSITRAMSFPLCSQSLVGFTPSDDGVCRQDGERLHTHNCVLEESSHNCVLEDSSSYVNSTIPSYYLHLFINTTWFEEHKPAWSVRLWLICRLSEKEQKRTFKVKRIAAFAFRFDLVATVALQLKRRLLKNKEPKERSQEISSSWAGRSRNTVTYSGCVQFHALPLDGMIKTESISFHVFKNETCWD